MKQTWKRFLTGSLALLLITAALGGCGAAGTAVPVDSAKPADKSSETTATVSATPSGEPKANPMEGTIKFAFPGDQPKAQDAVNKAVEEKLAKDGLNFKLEFTFYPWDQYWNKQALIAAGGEEYDLTWTHITSIAGSVNKKALAPLDEALQAYGQNLLSSTPDYSFKELTFDGKIYGIPRVMPVAESYRFVQIRGDLRKKYGIPEVTTLAGFEQYLAAIKEKEPDMIPFFGDGGIFLLREYGDVFTPLGDGLSSPVYIDMVDSSFKVKTFFDSEIFKSVMMKQREWMEKGYIPKDAAQVPDMEGALNSGKLAATWSVVLKTTERIDGFKAGTPAGELENVYLNPEKPKYVFNSADNILSVFSTSKKVNESIAFVNWMRANQENYDLFSLGLQDVNYKLDGESVSYDGIAEENSYMPINWSWNDIRFTRFSKFLDPLYVKNLRDWDKDAIITKITGFVFNSEPVKTEMAQINAIRGEFLPQLRSSEIDYDTTLASFLKKLKEANLEKVIAECQTQVDAYVK